jgi:hypothetical protein
MEFWENASERNRNLFSRLATHVAKRLSHVVVSDEED